MKTLRFTLVSLLIACQVMAGDMKEVVKFGGYSVTTNASTTVTNAPDGDKFYYGDFEGIYLDFTGSTGIATTVSLKTLGGTGSGPSRTLFSASLASTTDTWIPVRDFAKTTVNGIATNEYIFLPLFQDKLRLEYSSNTSTGVSFAAYVYIR